MVRRRRSDFTVVHCETRKRLASLLRAGRGGCRSGEAAPPSSVVTVVDVFSDAFGPCCVLPGILQDLTWNGTADGTRLQLALVDCARVLGGAPAPSSHPLLCPLSPSPVCVPPPAEESGGERGTGADADDDGASDGSSTDDDESSSGGSCDDVRGTDADPSVWSPLVSAQQERSQPLVLVYKDGCLLERIHGCRTALIKKAVGPLVCRASATQAGCLKQNPWLARLWEDAFGSGATEARWAAFVGQLRAGWLRLGAGAPCLSDADALALAEKLRARVEYGDGAGASPPPLPARRSRDEHLAALWRNGVVELRLVAAFVVGEPRAEDSGAGEGLAVVEAAVARLLPQFMQRVRVWREAKSGEEGKLRSALKGGRGAAAETAAAEEAEKGGGGGGGGGGGVAAAEVEARRVTFQDAVTTHLPHDDSRGTEGGEPSQGGSDRPDEGRQVDAAAVAADGSVGAVVEDAPTFTPVP